MALRHSAICEGKVRHRRYTPASHHFEYRISMAWLDLDELEEINTLPFWSSRGFNLMQYRRSDYLRRDVPDLKQAVYERLQEADVAPQAGAIRLLTHLRSWGFCFNPVSFYFCFNQRDELYAIVAEINNTPWNERHSYVLPLTPQRLQGQALTFSFDKAFHVSPFMPMALKYEWRFRLDEQRVWTHMRLLDNGAAVFDASLGLVKKPLTAANAWRAPLKFPFMCVTVAMAIYRQAFSLWRKGVPFYPHPNKKARGEGKPMNQETV
ncbi:DUF1365 domain-containing protein [Hahella sp. HN01]|uniref:DUF1365 domain-containing protein n=1 Tax=Hahella sp. HN01 TaxID=2847262 RepID=UPI001C1E9221|nr:DUF1365 domain-containing protein [Hahella sp. HN01]MBU6955776.1 DUF1365 domain-containing protein [Hahella sp. HN01]